MPITTQLANRVLKMRRQRMTVAQMAEALGRSEAEILEAHGMLGIGIADKDTDRLAPPLDEAGAALRDRIPKKWQSHYGKA